MATNRGSTPIRRGRKNPLVKDVNLLRTFISERGKKLGQREAAIHGPQ